MAPRKRPTAPPPPVPKSRTVNVTPDTVPLEVACARLGFSYDVGLRRARAELDLCDGVRIIRAASPKSSRPVYRVSVAQLDALLAPPKAAS